MFKRPLTLAIVALSIPLFGGIAYAATQSVSSEPSPKVVIPTSPTTDDRGGTRNATGGSDDPATHDNAGLVTTSTTSDNPATHDVGDDHGGVATTPTTNDDHGGRATTSTTSGSPVFDDHGGRRGSGSGSSGSGSGSGMSGGSDDPATHDLGDDHGGK
jgi:hypothetical protein